MPAHRTTDTPQTLPFMRVLWNACPLCFRVMFEGTLKPSSHSSTPIPHVHGLMDGWMAGSWLMKIFARPDLGRKHNAHSCGTMNRGRD